MTKDKRASLSPNFSRAEFENSETAVRKGIDNSIVDDDVLYCASCLANSILQPVREHFAKPVRINSGFRCSALNKAIGGSQTSQHSKGEAADIEIIGVSNYVLAKWIEENLSYDQLILEGYKPSDPNSGWVHVSYRGGLGVVNRKQSLTATFKNGKPTYHQGLKELA